VVSYAIAVSAPRSRLAQSRVKVIVDELRKTADLLVMAGSATQSDFWRTLRRTCEAGDIEDDRCRPPLAIIELHVAERRSRRPPAVSRL
jgi:hypothetical protein